MSNQHKLSASGKLAVVIGLAYLGAPAFAANIEAVKGGAQVQQQKGVDIVNIVKANEHGLSHNKYNKYDVSNAGAVLNNAVQAGKSQLAGNLKANANLEGKAAQVILNEVVSKNPSLILGQQEIFGMAADYVLANPNGITYNGGQITNANRASLVVGSAKVENGKLDHFDTSKNANALNVKGSLGGVSILDLVAPKVIVNAGAKVDTKNAINVVSGANKVGYTNGKVEKVAQNAKAPVLDGQVFGSMKSGSIRIHATDDRATQTVKGANLAASQDLTTDVAGNLHITKAKLSGDNVTLGAKNTTIDGVTTNRGGDVPTTISGVDSERARFTKSNSETSQAFAGSSITAKNELTLDNKGNLTVTGATIKAGSLNANANNITVKSETTTNTQAETYNRKKGLWHNNKESSAQQQTTHRTTIDVANNATVAAKNNLTLQGTALTAGKDVKVVGEKRIAMSGNVATDKSEFFMDVRNESGKLKTGKAAKAELNQKYTATEIKAGGDLGVQTAGNLSTSGAKISANGNAIVDAKHVQLDAATANTSNMVHDKFKYWGGLAGGSENGNTYTNENLQASSLTAKGNLLIGAKDGVDITGSVVKGSKGAAVNAGAGKLNVKHAVTNQSESHIARKGTIFNITKSLDSNASAKEIVNGSTLESETNLKLVSDKDVNVLGSSLKAAEKLGITTAGNLNIASAAAKSTSTKKEQNIKSFAEGNAKASSTPDSKVAEVSGGFGLRFNKSETKTDTIDQVGSNVVADQVDLNANDTVTIAGSNVAAKDTVNVTGKKVKTVVVRKVVKTDEKKRVTEVGIKTTASASNFDPKVNVKVGVDSKFNHTDSTDTTAQASNISGGSVTIAAQDSISHEGSNIAAEKNLTQTADSITQTAAHNTNDTTRVQHAGGIFVGAGASLKGVSVSGGIYGNGGKAHSTSTTAVAGSLKAGENVEFTAKTVTDEATNYDATGAVKIKADTYTNNAATSTETLNAKQGGASMTLTASTKDMNNINVNLATKVNYGQADTQSSKATIGNINAGSVSIDTVNDVNIASNITAKDSVDIASSKGNVNFTQSNDTESGKRTGVDVGLDLGAKVNVATGAVLPKGGVSLEVNHEKGNSSTGKAGTITAGGDVKVNTNDKQTINVNGASIISEGAVVLNAGDVHSKAIESSSNKTGVSVGGSLSLGTGLVKETVEHTETHMVQDNYCAPPREVTVTKTEEVEKVAIDSASFGAHVDLVKESGVSHVANKIVGKGEPKADIIEYQEPDYESEFIGEPIAVVVQKGSAGGLTINANNAKGSGISLTGTNVEATTATLTAKGGNINLDSAKGSLKKSNGGAGFELDGDVSQDGFKPTSGSAYLNVDVANNKTHTGSSITANKVSITTPNDLSLNSSTIAAKEVEGKVGGNLNVIAEQDVKNEVAVSLAAAGGKGIDPKSLLKTEKVEKVECDACGNTKTTTEEVTKLDGKKVAQTVLSDLQNGTILGVKAEAKVDVKVDKSKTTNAAGIAADKLNLDVNGNTRLQAANVNYKEGTGLGDKTKVTSADNQDSSRKVDFGFDVSTNVPKMVEYGIQHATTGTSPLFHASAGSTQTVAASSYTKAK